MSIRRAAVSAVAALAVGAPSAHACASTHVPLRKDNASRVSRATICLLNRERRRSGLHRLSANANLRAAAASHSSDMVSRRYFEHDGPSGDTLVSRAKTFGYLSGRLRMWGLAENIAFGTGRRGTAAAIVKSWMHSPEHRANILTASFRHAGIGLAQGTPSGTGGATYTLDLGYVRR
jgi:uncharacterized protein YkwD